MSSHISTEALLSHEAFVLQIARSLVRDESAARDLAQETWLAALENPPRTNSLRGWLARVVRSRASDARRGERRRAARQEHAARAEAIEASPSPSERLEIAHGVVAAVLALDEPYRSVVIAAYYEGLAPSEIAERRRVPPGTVRAQLSRALAELRTRLDREHGARDKWALALVGLLNTREPAAALGGSAVLTGAVAAAVVVAAGAAWVVLRTDDEPATIAVVDPPAAAETREELAPVVLADARDDVAPAAVNEPVESAPVPTQHDEIPALLERMRQIKALVLERRLKVADEDLARFAWLDEMPLAGITNLVERSAFGDRFELPWMRGGGAYFSFTEGVHDYNRRPQIGLQSGRLDASFYGGSDAMWVDLGTLELSAISTTAPPAMDAVTALEWRVAMRKRSTEHGSFEELVRAELAAEYENGLLGDAAVEKAMHRIRGGAPAAPGRTFAVRAWSQDEHDILVAVHVVRASAEQCTLAWVVLASWPVGETEPVRTPRMAREQLASAPGELLELDEAQLIAELGRLEQRVHGVVFANFTSQTESRFGALRQEPTAGLVRMLPYLGAWTELSRELWGAGAYSFVDRSHTSQAHDLMFQGEKPRMFNTYRDGAIVDLGAVALENADTPGEAASFGEAARRLVEQELARELPAGVVGDARKTKAAELDTAAWKEFERELKALGIHNRAEVLIGHTYLVRSALAGEHDVLAAVHVAEMDEYGVVIAWRELRRFPTTAR